MPSEGFGFCMLSHRLLGFFIFFLLTPRILIAFLLPGHSKEIIFGDS